MGDTKRTKQLRADLASLKAERLKYSKRLKKQGMSFKNRMRDPKMKAMRAQMKKLQVQIDASRQEVSAGSVSRTPGKNIRKSSTKVIVQPVVIKKETRVRS